MTNFTRLARGVVFSMAVLVAIGTVAEAAAPESKRLIRARDYIADEQWAQAISLLRAAADDPKEPRRDEALYWLAHSQHHSGDSGAAVATISRLEREFPASMWVKPGHALRIEIAVRLGRNDVLWYMAAPPRPAATPAPKMMPPRAAPPVAVGSAPEVAAAPAPPPARVRTPKPSTPAIAPTPDPPVPAPAPMWYAPGFEPDPDIQVQALGGLLRSDPDRAIPILARIAGESDKPLTASRAVVVLAQSPSPKARATVVHVAKTAPEPVRIAAVRALAGFGGRAVSDDLMQVFVTANEPVKAQIVRSLGEMEQPAPLVRIIQSEKDGKVRFTAYTWLGRAGGAAGAAQLATMYKTASGESKRFIIDGLFAARADTQLIQVAEIERTADQGLWREAIQRLSLLDTPKAVQYVTQEAVQKPRQKR